MELKDNTPYRDGDIKFRGKKPILEFFSAPIKELRDVVGGSLLFYPQSFYDLDDEMGEQTVFDITKRDLDGNPTEFWTRNLVGFISYKGQEVSVISRFSGEKGDNFLFYMLARVAGINLLNLYYSSQNKDKGLNLMLLLFPKLLKDALSQGLFKQYIYKEYNDANVRGPIDINRHIRRNIPFNGRVTYRTREFSYDNPVTQLVRHAIEWIKNNAFGQTILNGDETIKSFIQEIVSATPTYEARQRREVINQNLRPTTHPYYTYWQPLQEFCLRLLCHENLSYGTEKKNKIHGILIDAAWLWEEYIAQVLAEGTGMKHYTRKNSHYHLLEKDGSGFQKIIPDYLDVDNKIVADAKYIPLIKDELSAEKAAPVYYKTIMYMYRFEAKKGFLFHPVAKKKDEETGEIVAVGNEQVIENDYTIEGRKDCHLYKVGLVVEENGDWASYRKTMKKREEVFLEKIISKF